MKRISLLILALLFVFQSYSQIQNSFFGCVLGKTKYDEAVAKLRNQGYQYEITNTGGHLSLAISDCQYGGDRWETVLLVFYEDVFFSAFFDISEITRSKAEVTNAYNSYSSRLLDKYNDFVLHRMPNDGNKYYFYDSSSETCLEINLKKMSDNKKDVFYIQYMDYLLYSKNLENNKNAF